MAGPPCIDRAGHRSCAYVLVIVAVPNDSRYPDLHCQSLSYDHPESRAMSDKSLTESAWKTFSKQGSYKDGALVKALAAFEKSEKASAQEQLDTLDELDKQADLLRKANKADKKLGDYLDDLDKALGKQRKTSQDALAEEKKAAAKKSAEEDDEAESPALLTTKMIPLIREVRKGELVLHTLVAVAGKETVVLLSKKAISPARGKLLKEQMTNSSGLKFIRGECLFEENMITFVVQSKAAGLAKKLKAALFQQTDLRLKVRVRGVDPDDPDAPPDIETEQDEGDEGDAPKGGGEIPVAPPPLTTVVEKPTAPEPEADPLKLRFEDRLAKLEPKVAEALRLQQGDVSKIRAVSAFAREKGEAGTYAAGLQALDMLEKLLSAGAPTGNVPQAPPRPGEQPGAQPGDKPGLDPNAAFTARLTALMPKVKEALAAAGPAATDIKLKVSEAGVYARKRDFEPAQALLDEVEELLGAQAGPVADPKAAEHAKLMERLQPLYERANRGGLGPEQQATLQKVQGAWNLAQEAAADDNFERALLILRRIDEGGLLAGLADSRATPTGGDQAGDGDRRGKLVKQRSFMIQEWSKMPNDMRVKLQGLRGTLADADEDSEELVDGIADALEDFLDELQDTMDKAINEGNTGIFSGLRDRARSHELIKHLQKAPGFDGGALLSSVETALEKIETAMLAD